MKLAGVLPILFIIPAAAQSVGQHGIRIGQVQIAYLVEYAQATLPPGNLGLGNAAANMSDLMARAQAAQAKAGGAPVSITLNGASTILPPTRPTPRAEFETWIEPEPRDYAEGVVTGIAGIEWKAGKTAIRRFVRDNFRHVYVSYALTVETLLESGAFRVTVGDSDATPPKDLPVSENWKVVSPPKYPVPQILQDGETIALDLYSVTRTGQKLVEYIHLGNQAPMILRQDAARDSYADDAEFNITQPRLRANGLIQEPAARPEAVHGPVLSVYVPGHGRFVLSLKPHPDLSLGNPGFAKAGEVVGNSLTFENGGNVFRIDCAERIAPAGSGTYNVYARQASEPVDQKDSTGFTIGLAPTAEP